MAQVSSNTLTYDQIFIRIRDFYAKEFKNEFTTNEEKNQEYRKLVSDIYENIGGPTSKFIPFIKGEEPRSGKINDFVKDLGNDVSLISRQIDYLNGKIINAFNLFNQEVETEKRYVERIFSKAKILQMYSESPAQDINYLGDSFDNQDQIDIARIPIGRNPNIENGMLTLPIDKNTPWAAGSISIDTDKSNGFLGNDHEVIKAVNDTGSDNYEFLYKKNKAISSLSVLVDSNPITYFEYSAINVDKNSNPNYNPSIVSPNEFCYLSDKKVTPNIPDRTLIDWSNFDLSKNLIFKFSLENKNGSYVNVIDIVPYFGSAKLIKVSEIIATLKNGNTQSMLEQPVYIGSAFYGSQLNSSYKYYFNSAKIKFPEIEAVKFDITLEQESSEDIEIYHTYWRPNYQPGTGIDSPFNNLARFNPDLFSKDIYEIIDYDRSALIPSIITPNQFKDKSEISKNITVKLKKKPTVFDGYVISFTAAKSGGSPIKGYYYGPTGSNAAILTWSLQEIFEPVSTNPLTQQAAKYSKNANDLINDLDYLRNTVFASGSSNLTDPNGTANVTYYLNKDTDIQIENVKYTYSTQLISYSVPITLDKELYKAKKKTIGLRDVSIGYEQYANNCEVISTPYKFSSPIDTLMLSVDSYVDQQYSNDVNIKYYVSVNDSSWIEVSPIQQHFNGISEVLVFNKNIPTNFQIGGVAYLNYPQIPSEINKVVVKIEISKNRSSNITPLIYSYKLITKAKQ